MESAQWETQYLRSVMDAMPAPVFIVDYSYWILDVNRAAREFLGYDPGFMFRQVCGEVLRCIHALEPAGECGGTEYCADCPIRAVIQEVELGGDPIRRRGHMSLQINNEIKELDFLISASPFSYECADLVLLVLEDVTELMELRRIIPICAYCKRVRDDKGYWEQVESYLQEHSDLRFTHGICPECAEKLYSGFCSDIPDQPS